MTDRKKVNILHIFAFTLTDTQIGNMILYSRLYEAGNCCSKFTTETVEQDVKYVHS